MIIIPLPTDFSRWGGANEALGAIGMGTRMDLKIHERGEGAVRIGRHGFVPMVETEEHMMEFLKRFAGGDK